MVRVAVMNSYMFHNMKFSIKYMLTVFFGITFSIVIMLSKNIKH